MLYLFRNLLSASEQERGSKSRDRLPIINYGDLFTEGGDHLYKLIFFINVLKSTAKDKRLEHLHNPILEGLASSALSDTWSNELVSNRDLLYDITCAILSNPKPKRLSCLFLILIRIISNGCSKGHTAVVSTLEQYRIQTKQKMKFTAIRKALSKMLPSHDGAPDAAENALYFFAVFTDRQYFHGSFSGAVWDICYSSIIDQIHRLFSGAKESDIQMRLDISLDYLQRIKENLREGDIFIYPVRDLTLSDTCIQADIRASGISMDVSLLSAVCVPSTQGSREARTDCHASSGSTIATKVPSSGGIGHGKAGDITSLLEGNVRLDEDSRGTFDSANTANVVAPSAAAVGKDCRYARDRGTSDTNQDSDSGVIVAEGGSASGAVVNSQEASNTEAKCGTDASSPPSIPPPPPKAEFGLFVKTKLSRANIKGIQWTTLEKKEVPGSVWDDNYLVNKHSDGKIPVSLKKCDIERELRSNGTIREIEEWFSKKREVPRPISRMNISEFRKKNILPHGLDSRKAVNISVVMRTILRNHVHDDVLELIRHGNLGLIGVEIVDNLLAAVSYIDSDIKQKLLSRSCDTKLPDDIETYRSILLIPNVELKLQAMHFMHERNELVATIEKAAKYSKDLCILRDTLSFVVGPDFLQIMKTILFLGNHINKLNSANTAVGIKLSSVKNIAEFKSRSGEPFMKLLTKVIESNCPSSLQLFSNQDIVSKLNEDTVEFIAHCMEALRKGHDIISLEIDWQMGAMHGHHLSSYTSRIFLNKLQDTRKALNLDLEMVGTLHTKIDKQVSEVVALYKEARQSFGLIQILGILKFFASEFKKYSKSKFTEPEAEYIRRIQQEC